jgi:hypothetical protein
VSIGTDYPVARIADQLARMGRELLCQRIAGRVLARNLRADGVYVLDPEPDIDDAGVCPHCAGLPGCCTCGFAVFHYDDEHGPCPACQQLAEAFARTVAQGG